MSRVNIGLDVMGGVDGLAFAIAAASIAIAGTSRATDRVWDGSSSNNFLTPTNWTPAGTPVDGDTAAIDGGSPNGGDVVLGFANTQPFDGLTLTNNAVLSTNGFQLLVDDQTPLGVLTLFDTSVTSLEQSTLVVDSGASAGGTAVPDAHLDNLTIGQSAAVTLTNSDPAGEPSTLRADRSITNTFFGTLSGSDGRIVLGGPLDNNGIIRVDPLGGAANPDVNLTIDTLSGSSLIGVDLDGSDEDGLVRIQDGAVIEINAPLVDSVDNQLRIGDDARLSIAGGMAIGSSNFTLGDDAQLDVGRTLTFGLSTDGTPADVTVVSDAAGSDRGLIRVGRGGGLRLADGRSRQRVLISDPDPGRAVVRIEDGARLDTQYVFSNIQNTVSVTVGAELGESGRLEVDGAGSELVTNGILLGTLGDAEFALTDGGRVVTNGSVFMSDNVTSTAFRSSNAEVDGIGSTWEVSGFFDLGIRNGTFSQLDVTGGGRLNVRGMTIARELGSTGVLNVSGPGSEVMTEGSLLVAFQNITNLDSGTAIVDVSDFGVVMADGNVRVGSELPEFEAATMTIRDGGEVVAGGIFRVYRNPASGLFGDGRSTLNLDSGIARANEFQLDDRLTNAGTSLLEAPQIDFEDGSEMDIEGTLRVGGGLTRLRSETVTGNGTIRNESGNAMFLGPTIDLGGVSLENRGELRMLSDAPAAPRVNDFTQAADGEFVLEGFGDADFDRLSAGGVADLAGTLRLVGVDGDSEPVPYEPLVVVVADGGVNGLFDEVLSVQTETFLASNEALAVTYTATQVLVTRALSGDANLNGQIEQGDLNAVLNNWGASSGVSWATGDLDGDGTVAQGDLNAVLNNWGSSVAPDFRGFTVPEPGMLGIGFLTLCAVVNRRR